MTETTDTTKASAREVKREFEDRRAEAAAALETPVSQVEGAGERLLVRDVMTTEPVSTESGAPVVDAARAMLAEDVGSLPVVDEGSLVGMVTDRDLVLKVIAKDLDASKVLVSECCTEDPVVTSPDEPLEAALQRMAEAQVRRLPVVEDRRLVGIVAQADVARAAQRSATGELVRDISMS